jgi:spore germination protein GerM
MDDIYKDIEYIVGESGIMTHMLPNAVNAMQDWLREKISDSRFWDDAYDELHTGETELQPMTKDEQDKFWKKYEALPSLLSQLGTAKHD